MSATIIIRGGLSGREGAAYMSPSRPPRRDRGHAAHSSFDRDFGFILTVVKGRVGHLCDWKPRTVEPRFTRPMNSTGPFKAARNLFAACLHAGKQSGRCLFECLRISVAPEFHDQELTTGVFRGVGKTFGVRRNV